MRGYKYLVMALSLYAAASLGAPFEVVKSECEEVLPVAQQIYNARKDGVPFEVVREVFLWDKSLNTYQRFILSKHTKILYSKESLPSANEFLKMYYGFCIMVFGTEGEDIPKKGNEIGARGPGDREDL